MPQTYTGSVSLVVQSVDNVSGATLFNHAATNSTNAACTDTELRSVVTASTASVSVAAVVGLYIKNLSAATTTLTVSWDNGSGVTTIIVLQPGQFILTFQNAGTGLISNVSATPSASMAYEYAVWK